MAPKRGGDSGGSGETSSGIGSPSCPQPFQHSPSTPVPDFARFCVSFALTLVVLISLCCIKRKYKGENRLANFIFILSLLSTLIAYGLAIVTTMLWECDTNGGSSYNASIIAFPIFSWVGQYLFLVIVVWRVNVLLCEHPEPHHNCMKRIRITFGVILGLLGALTCSYIGLSSYDTWTFTANGLESGAKSKATEEQKLGLACNALYLLSLIATAATWISIRVPRGSNHLLGCAIALIVCAAISYLLPVISDSLVLRGTKLSIEIREAFNYISDLSWILSCVAVISLARSLSQSRSDQTYLPPRDHHDVHVRRP